MQSIVIHSARDLRVEQRDFPEPGAGQVLVRVATGGICGSDLHYYNHGGFGTVRLREPMILGHEVAGHVAALGADVGGLDVGDPVAVSPSRPCNHCTYCAEGLPNHCEQMRFYGSAMPFPHIQGAFREFLVADAAQCVKADGLTSGEAAMAEPLSVVLHAAKRAGPLEGRKVLVTGCGPIGTLAVLVARHFGAEKIVASDIAPNARDHAKRCGADRTIDPVSQADALETYAEGKGTFDVLFECSGAQTALDAGLRAMRPRGVAVQLGLGGDMTVPLQVMTAKELDLRGSFRFHEEFAEAVALMQSGAVDVKTLITHTVPIADCVSAFEIAADRSVAMKAQIDFS